MVITWKWNISRPTLSVKCWCGPKNIKPLKRFLNLWSKENCIIRMKWKFKIKLYLTSSHSVWRQFNGLAIVSKSRSPIGSWLFLVFSVSTLFTSNVLFLFVLLTRIIHILRIFWLKFMYLYWYKTTHTKTVVNTLEIAASLLQRATWHGTKSTTRPQNALAPITQLILIS